MLYSICDFLYSLFLDVPQLIRAQEKLVQNHRQQFRKWMFHIWYDVNNNNT